MTWCGNERRRRRKNEEAIQILKQYLDMDSEVKSEYLEAQRMAIKALEQTRWIPVSERLPEDDGYYFVTEKDGRIGIYVFHKQGNSEEYWKRCAIAWMPLPENYRGDKDGNINNKE